jgi:hypothetical protein
MSLKSVLSNLNGSYSSFAPSRSMSVTSALAENLKFNLRFRFSLLGMITSLTKSSSLYSLAQQRYIDRKDRKVAQEEISFKNNVAASVVALGKQVNLLESITEKNTAMINMIVNDLGYFKGQRKYNFMNSTNLGGLTSFKAPLNSKTVKGKLDIINEQIQELKKKGVGGKNKENDSINTQLLQDMGKIAIAGGVGAVLAGALSEQFGIDGKGGSAKKIAQLIGAAVGVASLPATTKVIEFVLSKTIPVVSQIGRIYLGVKYAAPFAIEKIGNSIERTKNRLTGVSNENEPPNPYPPGSAEYNIEEEKRYYKRLTLQAVDTVLLPATILLTAKYGSKGLKAIGRTGVFKSISAKATTAYRARYPTLNQKTRMAQGSFSQRVADTRAFKQTAAYNIFDRSIPLRETRAAASAARRGQRGIINRAGRAVRGGAAYVAGLGVRSKGAERLGKLAAAIKNNQTLRKLPIANLAYLVFEVGMMANAQENYDKDKDYVAYKEAMTGSLTRIVNVVGVSTLGALIGGIVGTAAFPIPLAGTAAGALLGAGAAIAASFAFSGINGDSAIAEKLFGIMFEDEKLESQIAAGTYKSPSETGEMSATAQSIEADLAAFNKVQKFEGANQIDGGVETILATIRQKESGNNYSADLMKNPAAQERARKAGYAKASASGAYQFVDGTWQGLTKKYNIGTQYQRAVDAPPAIQDMVAAAYVNEVLIATDGDVSKVPVAWYTGNIRGELSAQQLAMNTGLTVEKYQASWLDAYQKQGGASGTLMASRDRLNALRNNLAPQNSAEADQAMMKYFMSLGTIAQVLPTATETPAVAEQTGDATSAEIKAEAAVVGVKRTVEELTRVAENVKVLQQKNNMNEPFPHVRPA